MNRPLLTLLLPVLFAGFGALGQAADDTAQVVLRLPTVVRFEYESDFELGRSRWFAPDSGLTKLHRVLTTDQGYLTDLGNNGSATTSLLFQPLEGITTGFGLPAYLPNAGSNENQAFFRTNKRFTELTFRQGAFRESGIRFLHAQNITRGWNAGIDLERFTVKEFLPEGDTYFNRIGLFSSYHSAKGRYHLYARTSWLRIRNQVNGGLEEDSLFLAGSLDNLGLKGALVNLTDANNRVRSGDWSVSQYYYLRQPDSGMVSFGGTRLGYRIGYKRNTFTYSDDAADSTFYEDFFYGSASRDSSLLDLLTQRLRLDQSGRIGRDVDYFFAVGGEHQSARWYQQSASSWENIALQLEGRLALDSGRLELRAQAGQVLSGRDEGNFRFTVVLSGRINATLEAKLFGGSASTPPPILFERYSGNHLRWQNQFDPQLTEQLGTALSSSRWKTGFHLRLLRIRNHLFFGYGQRPVQATTDLNGAQLEFQKTFRWRKWGLDNTLLFQSYDRADQVRLPQWNTRHSFYFESPVFRKALLLRAGVDAWYCAAFNGSAFSPSLGQYYLQKEVVTGDFLRADLFMNLKIKTAGFFIKFSNAVDGLFNDAYQLVPSYPMPGRTFHFGVRWMFFDQ